MSNAFKPTTQQISNMATPITGDVLGMLRNQITGNTVGTGLGPLQQQAGTAIQQFVNSGGGSFDNSKLFGGMEDIFNRQQAQSQADLKEQFGSIGGRFGTGLANASALQSSQANAGFASQIGQISANEFSNQMNRLMSGIGMMQGMGTQNLDPFMQFAQTGMPTLNIGDSPAAGISGLLAGLGKLIGGIKGQGG